MHNPDLRKTAHKIVTEMIKRGELKRGDTCAMCSTTVGFKPVAHHGNYNKPHEIVWLCRSCHSKLHNETPFVDFFR